MLFYIEYCIIDLSDYDIKIGKTFKKNSSKSGSGIYARILDCNLSEYDTLTSWDGIIMSKFCHTIRFECQDIPFFMRGYDFIKSRYGGLGGILMWHYNDWIWHYNILMWP